MIIHQKLSKVCLLYLFLISNRIGERFLMDPAMSNKKSRDDDINGMSKIINKRARALILTKSTFSHKNDDLANHNRSIDDAGHTNPILLHDNSDRGDKVERTKEENFHPHVSLIENRTSHNKIIETRSPNLMKSLNKGLGRPDRIITSFLKDLNVRDGKRLNADKIRDKEEIAKEEGQENKIDELHCISIKHNKKKKKHETQIRMCKSSNPCSSNERS